MSKRLPLVRETQPENNEPGVYTMMAPLIGGYTAKQYTYQGMSNWTKVEGCPIEYLVEYDDAQILLATQLMWMGLRGTDKPLVFFQAVHSPDRTRIHFNAEIKSVAAAGKGHSIALWPDEEYKARYGLEYPRH